jgi:hypothetical protein
MVQYVFEHDAMIDALPPVHDFPEKVDPTGQKPCTPRTQSCVYVPGILLASPQTDPVFTLPFVTPHKGLTQFLPLYDHPDQHLHFLPLGS